MGDVGEHIMAHL